MRWKSGCQNIEPKQDKKKTDKKGMENYQKKIVLQKQKQLSGYVL